jgi:signal transduction histidine kinase
MSGRVIPFRPRARVGEVEAVLHDMRGPLTAIRGHLHAMVRAGGEPGEMDDRVRAVDAEIDRLVVAIDDARRALHGGGRDEAPSSVDVQDLLHETARRHSGAAVEAGVEVWVEGTGGATVVSGRADELRRLLDNLVGNAIRHAPRGTPVTLHCGRRGGLVSLGVRDQGPGLTEAGCGAAPAHGSGWGIGLLIVRDIAERHHGRLVRDEGASGLHMRVELPASAGAPRAAS